MHIAQVQNGIYLGFIRMRRNRISQENHQVNIIIDNLCAHLLFAAQVRGKIFMHHQIGSLLHQTTGCACGVDIMLTQNMSVSDTKVFHQFFLIIMCNQTNIHNKPPSNSDFVSFFLMFSISPRATMFVHMELPP